MRRHGSTRTGAAAAVLLGAVAVGGCADQEAGAFDPRGTAAAELATLFWAMVALGTIVFALVVATLIAAARAHRGDASFDDDPEATGRRSRRLVLLGGVALPVVVLVPLTVWMLVVADRLSPRLGDAYEIHVTGHQYWWEVRYPDAGVVTANEIHIPAGTDVRLVLESADVIHSVWVPQLAGKIDMIPGQTTEVRIDADEPGSFLGQCAEFCGLQHARMRFQVIALAPEDFTAWLEREAAPATEPRTDAARRGAALFDTVGCAACHTVRGTDANGTIGPDLTHIARRQTLGAGTVANGRGQLGGWIADPQAVKPGNLMPPTPLAAGELLDLIAYLEGLG